MHDEKIGEFGAESTMLNSVDLGLLTAVGETRGRHYMAGEVLQELRAELHTNHPKLEDPYPWMPAELRRCVGDVRNITDITVLGSLVFRRFSRTAVPRCGCA